MCGAAGDPLLVVMAEPAASLTAELRPLIPELRATVGDDRRVLVGFDRGGWSPTLFADLDAAGFDTLTWRKGATADIDEHRFATHSHTDEHGRTHTWRLADTVIELDIADGPCKGEVFAMRQISLFNAARTRQMHILTTRRDLPAAEIRCRMGSRWRQENHYRYARIHFDLDSHDTYRAGADDPTRMVPNPAKKPAYSRSRRPGVHCIRPKPPLARTFWSWRDRQLPDGNRSAGDTRKAPHPVCEFLRLGWTSNRQPDLSLHH